jgi:hypothetical protein
MHLSDHCLQILRLPPVYPSTSGNLVHGTHLLVGANPGLPATLQVVAALFIPTVCDFLDFV